MPATKWRDTICITKDAICRVWGKNLTFGDISNTLQKTETANYSTSITPTALPINIDKISKTAEMYKVLSRNTTTLNSDTSLSTTQKYKLDSPQLLSPLDLDKETVVFCNKRNILSDATLYYKLIYETFHNIKGIKITLQSDYEINNLTMVRFDVKIRDEIDNIIREEDKFYENIRKLISIDSMMNFVLTTQVV